MVSARVPVQQPTSSMHYGESDEGNFLIGIVDWARLDRFIMPNGPFHPVDLFFLRPPGRRAGGRSLLHQFAHAKPPALRDMPATNKKAMVPKAPDYICQLWVDFGYHLCDESKRQPGSVELRDDTGMTPLCVAASQSNGYFSRC